MLSLTLELASTIVDATLGEARARGFAPLCAVVLDPGGHALALKRDDGASISRPEIATAKAAGCLGMGFGGREIARRAQAMPGFFAAIGQVFPKGIVPVPGGVLIRDAEGILLGAVGVSGDTSDNDEIAALAGIAAAGLHGDTGA
ncbi:heme-binding protein [Sphingomonas sp. SUN039]|nr:heme-binding protein [Sphingomonas sp. SUN039]